MDSQIAIEGHSEHEIYYHLDLIRERGLIESPGSQPMLGITFERLSWEGHDYLDAIRDPEICRQTKKATDAVGGWTFELVKDLAKGLIKTKVQERGGVIRRADAASEAQRVRQEAEYLAHSKFCSRRN